MDRRTAAGRRGSVIRSYLPFAAAQVKLAMTYRMAFITRFFGNIITAVITYYLWRAIFLSSPEKVIGNFTFQEMTVYVIGSFLTSSMISAAGNSSVASSIQDGGIAVSLTKPVSFQGIQLAECLGNFVVNGIINLGVIFCLDDKIMLPQPQYLAAYAVSVFLSLMILFYFNFCFDMLIFYTTYFFGINMAKEVLIRFCSGALIPLSFFPTKMEALLHFLPFSSLNYTPVMICLGKVRGVELAEKLGIQLGWVLFFFLLSRVLWNKAIKRLTVFGG